MLWMNVSHQNNLMMNDVYFENESGDEIGFAEEFDASGAN